MLRRELAKLGRDPDLAPFECFLLCMACGHMTSPERSDPMRGGAKPAHETRCSACGTTGLADLRHTPTVHSLTELEDDEAEPTIGQRVGRGVGVGSVLLVLATVGAAIFSDGFGAIELMQAAAILIPLALIGMAMIPRVRGSSEGRKLPRRWRLPKFGLDRLGRRRKAARGVATTDTGDLLRAPLSGRPCLAYEIAVRGDDSPDRSFSSWRLVEQDNAEFRVGEVEVPRGGAVLRIPRELASAGVVSGEAEPTQHYMRMRGFLGSDEVYIYETILAPGDDCRVLTGDEQRPAQLFAA